MKRIGQITLAVIILSIIVGSTPPVGAAEKELGAQLGSLTCKSQPGTRVQYFLRTSVAIKCIFKKGNDEEKYKGEIGLLGVDLSKKEQETLYFTVLGVTSDVKMGSYSLQGDYSGVSIAAGIVKGGGTTQFIGGLDKSFSLVPSLDTFKGSGITAGVSRMKLLPDK